MAYGLYDQAADLVRIAIQREPQRRDLKLKLLEVFFVWGNKEQFLTMARELADTRAGSEAGEWEKIVIMGKQIAPEDPMFSDGGAGSAVGVDLNLDAGGSGRVDFDPFDVSSRLDVTGGGTRRPGRSRSRQRAARSGCHGRRPARLPEPPRQRWPDHARDDRQDDAGRLGSPDGRAARAASARRADDSREGRRRDAPQAELGSDRRARARRSRPRTRLARTDGFAARPQAGRRLPRGPGCQRPHHGGRPRRELTAPAALPRRRATAAATPTIRSSPNTARAAPGSSPSASSAATWT